MGKFHMPFYTVNPLNDTQVKEHTKCRRLFIFTAREIPTTTQRFAPLKFSTITHSAHGLFVKPEDYDKKIKAAHGSFHSRQACL
ncbi:MAG: hypothetical protein IJN24_01940 [Bacteroidaceae bacterium]|nr:hypothetical protein [Bacteroidaceae bacterium]